MKSPDGREIFVWTGRDHKTDIDALTSTIAANVPGLVDYAGSVGFADASGAIGPAGPAVLKELIGQHICGARLVMHDGTGGVWDYYTYAFAPRPRRGPPTMAAPNPNKGLEREPWAEDLDEIFRHELAHRLPKVIE